MGHLCLVLHAQLSPVLRLLPRLLGTPEVPRYSPFVQKDWALAMIAERVLARTFKELTHWIKISKAHDKDHVVVGHSIHLNP